MYTFANFTFLGPRDFKGTVDQALATAMLLNVSASPWGASSIRISGTPSSDPRISSFIDALQYVPYDPNQQGDLADDI
ncbi:hypothetical protein [Rhizobium grahamii]|uniref:hypothetical protein n=1 Tax=Rhizobium grahamii TaxID=1120045 RepID=UPI00030227E1|nr:hypothetical protein [Rhizobium grahamii]